jgi:hypothetical protein
MDQTIALPFAPAKQLAILGHCLKDRVFFQQCLAQVKPDWFGNIQHGKIWKAAGAFHVKYNHLPSSFELKTSSDINLEKEPERTSLRVIVDESLLKSDEIGLNVIRGEMTEWYHARLFREGHDRSEKHYNAGQFGRAYAEMSDSIRSIQTNTFDEDTRVSFLDPSSWLKESEEEYQQNGLTTGLKILDAALSPDGSATPSLYKGDMTVLLAPVNVGKSSTMITVIAHNIIRQQPILFYSHEGRLTDLREKIFCCVTGRTKHELFALYKTEKGVDELNKMSRVIEKYLDYVPYNRPGMTVEQVMGDIMRRQQARKIKYGIGYQLLVSDYPAKLFTDRAKGGQLQQRNIDAIVYDQYVQSALQEGWHALVAIQTNRSGSVANRDDERLLTMEDVAESWGVMAMATNVISLNRNVTAAQANRLTFYVAKSRSSQVGRAVVARSNYACCRTHGDWPGYGGTWYRGQETLSDQIERLMVSHEGREISPTDISEARAK